MALSTSHSILVKKDGSMWTSGLNSNGQLGIGETMPLSKSFIEVMSSGVMAAAAGVEHSVVVKADGSVWVTGKNSKGQLATTGDKDVFSMVDFPGHAKAVAAGSYHSLVVTDQGGVWLSLIHI